MTELPSPSSHPLPSLPHGAMPTARPPQRENRRLSGERMPVIYPILLLASTLSAAAFCLLYLQKPVIEVIEAPRSVSQGTVEAAPRAEPAPPASIISSDSGVSSPPSHGGHEETNLRVQHVLSAEFASGRSDRIELNVPVLYRSRGLRWTMAEVSEARALQERLFAHQEKSRALREEGLSLLQEWNDLISRSMPVTSLRADSPSLPENQEETKDAPRPGGWTSSELIQIKTDGK